MSKKEALVILENMPEDEFQKFFKKLPERVKILIRANFVNWREILPKWYIKKKV